MAQTLVRVLVHLILSTKDRADVIRPDVDFRITRYTTDEELDKYAEILKEKGPEALRRALEKVDVGRINAVGRHRQPDCRGAKAAGWLGNGDNHCDGSHHAVY